ncbi:MAG: ribonuclease D [Lysobacterales bacterium CG_4_10_14_3_um_filter_64_11]|nr:MAG: ribonuclease D [Xanthomonadales bacterium CG_4_10_14_3_um_filter_64_11]
MAATDFTQWNTAWVADSTILHARLAAWEGQPTVALDTEFIRERTFWAQLALVQLAVPGEIVLADPLAPGICAVLGEFFARKGITWLMHAAGEDLQALRVSCGVVPEPLFDTQCAAALSGIGAGMSYQRLVEQVTGVALEKGETRSDWLRRPLSESQCRYAADDVRHLHAIHGDLSQRLAGLRRADWLAQECARQVANELDQQPEPRPHLALRSAQGLSGDGQWRLCRLLHWREVQARASDRPRTWILDNELAATLARLSAHERGEFDHALDNHPKAPRKLRESLWAVVADPLPVPADFVLASVQGPGDRDRLHRLQAAIKHESERLGLPEGVLASRRLLEARMQHGRWPADTARWRLAILEPLLAPLL